MCISFNKVSSANCIESRPSPSLRKGRSCSPETKCGRQRLELSFLHPSLCNLHNSAAALWEWWPKSKSLREQLPLCLLCTITHTALSIYLDYFWVEWWLHVQMTNEQNNIPFSFWLAAIVRRAVWDSQCGRRKGKKCPQVGEERDCVSLLICTRKWKGCGCKWQGNLKFPISEPNETIIHKSRRAK